MNADIRNEFAAREFTKLLERPKVLEGVVKCVAEREKLPHSKVVDWVKDSDKYIFSEYWSK